MQKLHYRKMRYWKYKTYKRIQFILPYTFNKIDLIYVNKYLTLRNGILTIDAGYSWDGPSGPAIDTDNFMNPSLVHDALYQLIREGHLSGSTYRIYADQVFRDMALAEGMSELRAWNAYYMVRIFYPIWNYFSKKNKIPPTVRVI